MGSYQRMPTLPAVVKKKGVPFIGPGADIIAKMGIKTEARKIMREAGLPIVPGTEAPVQGIEEVKKAS